jgi:cobalt-zinc-cadmium efflux system membrane fusion protein
MIQTVPSRPLHDASRALPVLPVLQPPCRIRAGLAALLIGALLVGALLAGCTAEPPPPVLDPGPSVSGTTIRFPGRVEGLRTETVQDAGTTILTLPGRLAWDEDRTVRVFSPFAGRVIRPLVQVGDTVRAGQALAELASPEFGTATAEARRAEAEERLAKDTMTRVKELADAGLVPTKDLREAEAGLARASIERQRAQARLTQLGAGAGPNFTLRSPIAGIVVERSINPGQELRADQGDRALYVVTDPSQLWVWLDAPESALPVLAPLPLGTAIKLRSGAWGAREFDAKLVRKEDAIDATSRTFRLRAAVANPERLLKGEMFVSASFPLPEGKTDEPIEHLPVSAVLLVDGRKQVFVADADGGFTRIEVQVVRELPGRVGVTGLAPGQRVVVEGNLYLQQILARGLTPRAAQAQARDAKAKAGAGAGAAK